MTSQNFGKTPAESTEIDKGNDASDPSNAERKASAQPPIPGNAPATDPFARKVLSEAREIARATYAQARRVCQHMIALQKTRGLRKASQEKRVALGRKMYDSQLGEQSLRDRLAAVDDQLESAKAANGSTKSLLTEQKGLLIRLADAALAQQQPPAGAEDEWSNARTASDALSSHEDKVAKLKADILPKDSATWRRVAIGCGAMTCAIVLAVMLIPGGRTGDEQVAASPKTPGTEEVAGSQMKLDTEEIVAHVEPSVAQIVGQGSSGTGFVIEPGIVATNAHVCESELVNNIKVRFPSEGKDAESHAVKLLYLDKKRDVAFLKLDAECPPPLSLASAYRFVRGAEVTTIGNPGVGGELTLQNAVSRGVMSTEVEIDDQQFYQLSISINPGNSGGPVLDSGGRVIGIATLKAKEEEGIAFCVPLADVTEALKTATKQDQSQIELVNSKHDLRVVFNRIAGVGELYLIGLDMYEKCMTEAVRRGHDVNSGLQVASREVDDRLAPFGFFLDHIKADVSRIASDTRLPQTHRDKLVELWTNYSEMRSYIDSPRGNLTSYTEKVRDLRDKHERLVESLKLMLGVTD